MKILVVLSVLLGLATVALAWDQVDYEIFDLVSDLEGSEGKGTTFYNFLNVTKSATTREISTAYRKRSLELHPDKNPNDPDIQERFARLGVISAILRDGEKRIKYDYFHDHGVPVWRGTGYYYSRWKPGLTQVLIFLVFISTMAQHLIMRLNHSNELNRIKTFQTRARKTAGWKPPTASATEKENGTAAATGVNGSTALPTSNKAKKRAAAAAASSASSSPHRRIVRIPLRLSDPSPSYDSDDDDGPQPLTGRAKRATRKMAGAGGSNTEGTIEMMVDLDGEDSGRVVILTEDGDELPLDSSAAAAPSFKRTWFPSLISHLYSSVLRRFTASEDSFTGTILEGEQGENSIQEVEATGEAAGNDSNTVTPDGGSVESSRAATPAPATTENGKSNSGGGKKKKGKGGKR